MKEQRAWEAWVYLGVLTLVWGSSFVLMDTALYNVERQSILSPVQLGLFRMFFSSIVLLPIFLFRFKKILKTDWKWLAVVGLIGSFIPAIMFAMAQQFISSSFSGMLNSLTPLMVVVVGLVFYKASIPVKKRWGVLIGLIGAIGLFAFKGLEVNDSRELYYGLFIVVATMGYGFSVNTIKYKLAHMPALLITAGGFSLVFLPALLALLWRGDFSVFVEHPDGMRALYAMLPLSLIGTSIAVVIYSKLTHLKGPVFASSVTYLIPIVALALGYFIKGDQLIWGQVLALLVLLLGVYLMNRKF